MAIETLTWMMNGNKDKYFDVRRLNNVDLKDLR